MISNEYHQNLETYIQVETPEGIELHAEPAGLVLRVLAYSIDIIIRGIILGIFGIIFSFFGNVGQGLILLLFFLIEWFYSVLFEIYWNGQTIGKRLMNIRVVNEDFSPVQFSASLCRNLLRVADFFPLFYILGTLSLLTTKKSQRLGDLAAKTLVIQSKSDQVYNYDLTLTKSTTAIAPCFTLDAPLRHAFVDFSVNRGKISSSRQEELAEILSPIIQAKSIPPIKYAKGVGKWILGNNSKLQEDSNNKR